VAARVADKNTLPVADVLSKNIPQRLMSDLMLTLKLFVLKWQNTF